MTVGREECRIDEGARSEFDFAAGDRAAGALSLCLGPPSGPKQGSVPAEQTGSLSGRKFQGLVEALRTASPGAGDGAAAS